MGRYGKQQADIQTLSLTFPSASRLAPPVMPFNELSFGYSGYEALYQRLNFGIDCDSRVALVGPNGCGKSTLLNLMGGELVPTEGSVQTHPHCTLGDLKRIEERLEFIHSGTHQGKNGK